MALNTYTRERLSWYTLFGKIFAFQVVSRDLLVQYLAVDSSSFLVVQPAPFIKVLAQTPDFVKEQAFCFFLVVIDDSMRIVNGPGMLMNSSAQIQVFCI